jgi:hypothetical protein
MTINNIAGSDFIAEYIVDYYDNNIAGSDFIAEYIVDYYENRNLSFFA